MIFTSHGLVPGQLWSNVLPGDRDRIDYILFIIEDIRIRDQGPDRDRFRIRCLRTLRSGQCEVVTISPPRLMSDWRSLGYRRVM